MKNCPINPSLVKKSENPFSLFFMAIAGIILAIVMSSCSQSIPCPSYGNRVQQKKYAKNHTKKNIKKVVNLFASTK